MLFLAIVGGVLCLVWYKQDRDRNEQLAKTIADQNAQIARLKGEGEKIQQQMTPDQKALLSASHTLVANKRFGWSRLFADLEGVLPSNVSASRIGVSDVFIDGDKVKADLEFSVLSRDYPSVLKMIENMQNSGRFMPELRSQDLQKGETITYSEYTLRLIYSPDAGLAENQLQDVANLNNDENGGGRQ